MSYVFQSLQDTDPKSGTVESSAPLLFKKSTSVIAYQLHFQKKVNLNPVIFSVIWQGPFSFVNLPALDKLCNSFFMVSRDSLVKFCENFAKVRESCFP
jgi:hypothetical protein